MEEIEVVEETAATVPNANMQISGDYSYTVLSDGTCEITDYSGTDAELVIPEELDGYVVTSIGNSVFNQCKTLTSVTLPDTVRSLGRQAFSYCTLLTQVVFNGELETIGEQAFYGCDGLTEIDLGNRITVIGNSAFAYCKGLNGIQIPSTVTNIGSYAFQGCSALQEIVLYEGLNTIGTSAFNNCDALTTVTIPDSVTNLGATAFYGCDGLTEVHLGSGITEIKSRTFGYCKKLLSVDIPETITSIGDQSFDQCTALETVTLHEGLNLIESSAFTGCKTLAAMDIPSTVTEIRSSAFSGCSGLEELTLRKGLTTLGPYVFQSCKLLASVEIPDTVTQLPLSAFNGCTNLTTVILPEGLTRIGESAFSNCTSLKDIQFPETVTTIGTYAFDGCKALESIQIPESLTALSSYLFRGCASLQEIILHGKIISFGSNVFENCTALQRITLPEDLSLLGQGMFMGCTALEEIIIPESITRIPLSTFQKCSALSNVVLPETLTEIGASAFKNCSRLEQITLPENITTMGSSAFSYCSALKSVELPSQMTVLSSNLFEYCKSLETVIFPEQLKETSTNTFYHCESLKEINLPGGLETIASGTFTYCTALEEVVIPDSVTSVKGVAFSYCEKLKKVQLPPNITELNGTFAWCKNLESIEIPESVTVIGEKTFYECRGLLTVRLPAGLQEIKSDAFMMCSSLTSIEIPDGVKTIPYSGFHGCTSLKHIKLPATLEVVGQNAFWNCPLRAVNLPEGLTTIYADAFPSFQGDIVVPSSVTTFGKGAFRSSAVFYCDLCSSAAAYAINNGIPIVERKDPAVAAASSLNRDNSCFKASVDGIGASGNLSFTGQYEFKSGVNVSDLYFQTDIPDHLELQYETMTLDGQKITNFEYGTDGVLKIPLTNTSGVIRFQLRPMSYKKIVFYTTMKFKQDGSGKSEILGTVYEMLPALSINAATETSSSQMAVSGITIPGNKVTLLVDGVEKATATANKIGGYSATVDLGTVAHGSSYTITAKTNNGSSVETATKTVTYKSNIPMLEDLTIYHAGQKIALSEVKGSRPVLVFDPDYDFEYCVEIQNPELVETIFIISRRGSEERLMEAVWDEGRQAFVVGGRFDTNNTSYVPGDLSVEYVPKMEPVDFASSFDYTSKEKYDNLPESWKNADVLVNENTANKADLSISIPEADGTTTSFRAVSERTNIPEGLTSANAEANGYTKITDSNGNTQYTRIVDKNNALIVDVADFGAKTYISSKVENVLKAGKAISAASFGFNTFCLFSDFTGDLEDSHELWSKIYNSDLSADAQADLMSILGVGVLAQSALTMFQGIALIGFAAVAITGGLFAAPAMAAYAVTAAVLGVAKIGVRRWMKRSLYAREVYHRNGRLAPRWAIDPSGYVYDAETQVRIHGATVSVYWLPYDGTDETYWDRKPAATVMGEKWDASEFSQENPLTTDIEGRYAWDVPEGWWRVKCEHPDYETTWSDWVPVPPPQTEVNIAMKPLPEQIPYDYNQDEAVNDLDAVYLLWHALFPLEYPIVQKGDFDGDNHVNETDATYFFWHFLFPEMYPL